MDMSISEQQNRRNDGSDQEDEEEEDSYMTDRALPLMLIHRNFFVTLD